MIRAPPLFPLDPRAARALRRPPALAGSAARGASADRSLAGCGQLKALTGAAAGMSLAGWDLRLEEVSMQILWFGPYPDPDG